MSDISHISRGYRTSYLVLTRHVYSIKTTRYNKTGFTNDKDGMWFKEAYFKIRVLTPTSSVSHNDALFPCWRSTIVQESLFVTRWRQSKGADIGWYKERLWTPDDVSIQAGFWFRVLRRPPWVPITRKRRIVTTPDDSKARRVLNKAPAMDFCKYRHSKL